MNFLDACFFFLNSTFPVRDLCDVQSGIWLVGIPAAGHNRFFFFTGQFGSRMEMEFRAESFKNNDFSLNLGVPQNTEKYNAASP